MDQILVKTTLKSRISCIMKEKSIAYGDLRELAGLHPRIINDLKNERITISLSHALKISNALGVRIEDLFYEELVYHKSIHPKELSPYTVNTIQGQQIHINYNTNIIHSINDSQVQQGNIYGNMNNGLDIEGIVAIISIFKTNISNLKLSEISFQQATKEISEAEQAIRKPNVSRGKVKEILQVLKRILEGAVTSEVARQLQSLIELQLTLI